jgi:hypothetical protein
LKNSKEFFAHVLYYDFVSLSDTKLGDTSTQIKKLNNLNQIIRRNKFYKNSKKLLIVLSTGDGGVIISRTDPYLILELVIELHKKLRKYNKTKNKKERLLIRIGINSGTVFPNKGLKQKRDYWGPGIIYAQRVMNFGTSNHILLDASIATELIRFSEKYRRCIHYLGIVEIKHGEKIPIYSTYDHDFGNRTKPKVLKTQISPDLIEKTGSLILEEVSKQEMEPKEFVKMLEQKEKSKLKLSIVPIKKLQTRKVKKRRGRLR